MFRHPSFDRFLTRVRIDLAKDPAFRRRSRLGSKFPPSRMPLVSDSTRAFNPETRDTRSDRDRSFLTITTGELVEAEITPVILDVVRCCKVAFKHDNVSTRP
jgi:hypothetical protein